MNGASAERVRSSSRRASSIKPAARNVRPQHSGRRSPGGGAAVWTRKPAASSTRTAARAFSGSNQVLNVSAKRTTSDPLPRVGEGSARNPSARNGSLRQRGSGRLALSPRRRSVAGASPGIRSRRFITHASRLAAGA